jgi:hypothetical protein
LRGRKIRSRLWQLLILFFRQNRIILTPFLPKEISRSGQKAQHPSPRISEQDIHLILFQNQITVSGRFSMPEQDTDLDGDLLLQGSISEISISAIPQVFIRLNCSLWLRHGQL